MNKYQSLSERLSGHRGDEWRASFAEIEDVLGFPLPKAARAADAWWSNTTDKPHNRAWTKSGWEVGEVDRKRQKVTFRRPVSEADMQRPAVRPMARGGQTAPEQLVRRLRGQDWRWPALIASVAAVSSLGAMLLRRAVRRS